MKRVSKVLCVFLAFVMVFSTTSIAFAKNQVTPVIVMHGLGGSDLYNNVNDPKNKSMIAQYGLDTEAMLQNQTIVQEALKLLDDGRKTDYNKLFDELGNVLGSTGFNCTPDGDAQPGQGIDCYWTDSLANHPEYFTLRNFSINSFARQIAKMIGAKNVYAFNFDWRLDVYETAKQLRSLVVEVKKQTGAKKVTIVGMSLGGAVMSAYLDAYKGKKDVEKYVFLNGAQLGVDAARLFRLDFQLNKKSVLSYLKHLETAFEGGAQHDIFRAVNAFGDARIGTAINKLNRDVCKNPEMRNKLYLTVMARWMANCPSPWECIPYKDFNVCVEKMSKLGILDKSSGLYKKIKRYHKIQGRFKSNIKWAKKHGAEVVIIANYGTKGLPLTSKKTNQTDMVIDTKYASAGATTAQFGKKLKKKGKYVSPDKAINAATCALPNNTWFFRGVTHGIFRYDTQATKLVCKMIVGKVKCTVPAVKKKYGYKQFIKVDDKQNISNV
ncbi:MAG: hypothetical protein IKF64_07440 [Eubacterium sp.]|nr:hypothetical protein [Eubacterium sp.]